MSGERVLGVDACKTGWVGIVLSGDATTAHAAATIGQLVGAARLDGHVDVVAIDMPIVLPDAGTRAADLLARAVVGRRRSSVFITPVRAALDSPDHASAVAVNRRLAGAGVSAQAFALRAKLLQVNDWVRHPGRQSGGGPPRGQLRDPRRRTAD